MNILAGRTAPAPLVLLALAFGAGAVSIFNGSNAYASGKAADNGLLDGGKT